jgi:hypothetical protein
MASSDSIPLIELIGELRRSHDVIVPYSRLWRGCVEASFPAQRVRNRWFVRRCDLPLVIEALGIDAPAAPETPATVPSPAIA